MVLLVLCLETPLCVSRFHEFYSERFTDDYPCLTEGEVKLLMEIAIDNNFVSFAGLIFRQITGIPMGSNCSPLLADLFLSWCEYEFMVDLNREEAKDFSSICRYIDDIAAFDCPNFVNKAKNIYPLELSLEETTRRDGTAPFLDLDIAVGQNFHIKVYDKTDAFGFKVIKYCFADSNMHINLGPKVLRSQLVRFARISTDIRAFEERMGDLVISLMEHGFAREILLAAYCRFAADFRGLLMGLGLTDINLERSIIARTFYR